MRSRTRTAPKRSPKRSRLVTGQSGIAALADRFSAAAVRLFPRVYLATALAVGALMCFLIPPFQVPDEPEHFFRAVRISELHLLPEFEPSKTAAGAMLPSGVQPFAAGQFFEFKTLQHRTAASVAAESGGCPCSRPICPPVGRSGLTLRMHSSITRSCICRRHSAWASDGSSRGVFLSGSMWDAWSMRSVACCLFTWRSRSAQATVWS
jgi:hypothetical protein